MKTIVFATYAGIGDFFLSLPLIAALEKITGEKPDLLIRSDARFRDFLPCLDFAGHITVYDKTGRHKSLYGQLKLIFTLRRKKYHLGLTLHPGKRYVSMLKLTGAEIRCGGSETTFFRRFLTHPVPDKDFDPEFYQRFHLQKVHGLECFLYFLKRLGFQETSVRPQLKIPESVRAKADLLTVKNRQYFGFNPGASGTGKIWPLDRFIDICHKIRLRYPAAGMIFFGGPQEKSEFSVLAEQFPDCIFAMGNDFPLTLNTELLSRCCLLISNDTGIVHIASYLDIPVISIGGGARTGEAFKAWSTVSRNLLKEVSCSRNCHECRNCLCVKEISVSDVLAAAESCLSEKKQVYHA